EAGHAINGVAQMAADLRDLVKRFHY
ncbi:MAG: hypothetical protein QOG74_1366, partial [Alphaproteobacteria bacterium]|nr:hypothetical protein [Alphaproteobacteria bacterium]